MITDTCRYFSIIKKLDKHKNKRLSLAEKTIDKIFKRLNGSDLDERTYWAVLKIIDDYRDEINKII